MKKELEVLDLTVPEDKCELDVLAELKERCKNAWIYMHKTSVDHLTASKGVEVSIGSNYLICTWRATEEYPETKLVIAKFSRKWCNVLAIEAEDIAFKDLYEVNEPQYIIRLRREA